MVRDSTPRSNFTFTFLYETNSLTYGTICRTNLQSQANILTNNLQNVASTLSSNHPLLSSTVAFPLPTYPGRTHEGLLQSLIRKRLDPSVEDWVERGKDVAATAIESTDSGLTEHELEELWEWAPVEANKEARRRAWGGDYTLEEKERGIKNVVTGLKRKLEEGESESSGDEDDEDDEDYEDGTGEDDEPHLDSMEIVGVRSKSDAKGLEFAVARVGDKPGASASTSAAQMGVGTGVSVKELLRFGSTLGPARRG
jgi:mediator of RNA polymerase II transcription subunit 8, fungi type